VHAPVAGVCDAECFEILDADGVNRRADLIDIQRRAEPEQRQQRRERRAVGRGLTGGKRPRIGSTD
jgi:hypothetical protein